MEDTCTTSIVEVVGPGAIKRIAEEVEEDVLLELLGALERLADVHTQLGAQHHLVDVSDRQHNRAQDAGNLGVLVCAVSEEREEDQ